MINYGLLNEALIHYRTKGYQYIEVPWLVPHSAIASTTTVPGYKVAIDKVLIGSGEQGFVKLMMDGCLPEGKYCTITPCFRQEALKTPYTREYFMKLELIKVEGFHEGMGVSGNIGEVMGDAEEFMRGYIPDLDRIPTDMGYDLIHRHVELGSYGYREWYGHRWTYGTGLAEPRFSTYMKVIKHV